MSEEVYQNRMNQIKQWLDEDAITVSEMFQLMSQAMRELFANKFNEAMEE